MPVKQYAPCIAQHSGQHHCKYSVEVTHSGTAGIGDAVRSLQPDVCARDRDRGAADRKSCRLLDCLKSHAKECEVSELIQVAPVAVNGDAAQRARSSGCGHRHTNPAISVHTTLQT
jgi:hypothetical protein